MTAADDFNNGPISDFGVSVTRTAVTTTTDFNGNKTYTNGSDTSITVVFQNIGQDHTLDKAGLTENFDARMFVKSTETINKYDIITHNSKTYRVDNVSDRLFDGTVAYKKVDLFFI